MTHTLKTFGGLCEMLWIHSNQGKRELKRWLIDQGFPTQGLMPAAVQDAAIAQFDPPVDDAPRHGCLITLERFCEIGQLSQPEVKTFLNSRGFRTAYGLTESASAVAIKRLCSQEMAERINREIDQEIARSLAIQKWRNSPAPVSGCEYLLTVEKFCRLCPLLSETEVKDFLESQGFAITQVMNNETYLAACLHFAPIASDRQAALAIA